jgi:hypothetical protein
MLGILVQVVIESHFIDELEFQFLSFDLCPLQVHHPLLSFELSNLPLCATILLLCHALLYLLGL